MGWLFYCHLMLAVVHRHWPAGKHSSRLGNQVLQTGPRLGETSSIMPKGLDDNRPYRAIQADHLIVFGPLGGEHDDGQLSGIRPGAAAVRWPTHPPLAA